MSKEEAARQMHNQGTDETQIRTQEPQMRDGQPLKRPRDEFMKAWVNLRLIAKNPSVFGRKKQKEEVLAAAKMLKLDQFGERRAHESDSPEPGKQPEGEELLSQEYVHLLRLVAYLDENDYGFTHHVLGIGKLDESAVQEKIRDQVQSVVLDLLARFGLEELFAPLARAADEALGV